MFLYFVRRYYTILRHIKIMIEGTVPTPYYLEISGS